MITDLIKNLKNDKDLYYAYQANIAMAFTDEAYNYKKKTNKKYLNQDDMHVIANEAAKNFLNLLIR